MHKLEILATVNNADGSEYYFESHRWNGLSDDDLAMMQGMAKDLAAHAQKVHDGKGDKSARLMLVVDDGAPAIIPFSGVSKDAIRSLEREFLKAGNRLIDESEKNDKGKGKGK